MTAAPVNLFTVQLQDEAPVIGSGFRFVFVKHGRKWVYLLSPYTMQACKLRRSVWERLAPEAVTDPDTVNRARQALAWHPKPLTRFAAQAAGGAR